METRLARNEQSNIAANSQSCLLVSNRDPDYAQSLEFDFLQSYLERQINIAFGSHKTFPLHEHSNVQDFDSCTYVLLLRQDRILIAKDSLKRMKTLVDQGSRIVSAFRFVGLPQSRGPLYTLRQYEKLENQVLSSTHTEPWKAGDQSLALLMSYPTFASLLKSRTPQELLQELSKPQSMELAAGLHHAGLFYQFIDYYGMPRPDIIPFVPENSQDVLEIGCGKGLTGKLLQQTLDCKVTGVELNPDIAEHARRNLFRVITGNIESLTLNEKFDVVLATELFEHLLDPMQFLSKMKSILKPGGHIVLSVPNVGHWSIVEDLLFGRWDYVPVGLLCYTHLRFFTRKTLEDWIQRSGFSSYEITPQTTELPERFSRMAASEHMDMDSLKTKGFYVVLRT